MIGDTPERVWYYCCFCGAKGERIAGTKVTSGNIEGEVVEAEMVRGYNAFTIKWKRGGHGDSKYSTDDVLRHADDDQGVVSLEEDTRHMNVFLLATLCMVNVQVYEFITNDVKVENIFDTCPLDREEASDNMNGREYAWNETKRAAAVDMLHSNEREFLVTNEDKGLLEHLKKESCFKMMGLGEYAKVGKTGLSCAAKRNSTPNTFLSSTTSCGGHTRHLDWVESQPGVIHGFYFCERASSWDRAPHT